MEQPASLEDNDEQVAASIPTSTGNANVVGAGSAVRQLPVQPTPFATMKVLKL